MLGLKDAEGLKESSEFDLSSFDSSNYIAFILLEFMGIV